MAEHVLTTMWGRHRSYMMPFSVPTRSQVQRCIWRREEESKNAMAKENSMNPLGKCVIKGRLVCFMITGSLPLYMSLISIDLSVVLFSQQENKNECPRYVVWLWAGEAHSSFDIIRIMIWESCLDAYKATLLWSPVIQCLDLNAWVWQSKQTRIWDAT